MLFVSVLIPTAALVVSFHNSRCKSKLNQFARWFFVILFGPRSSAASFGGGLCIFLGWSFGRPPSWGYWLLLLVWFLTMLLNVCLIKSELKTGLLFLLLTFWWRKLDRWGSKKLFCICRDSLHLTLIWILSDLVAIHTISVTLSVTESSLERPFRAQKFRMLRLLKFLNFFCNLFLRCRVPFVFPEEIKNIIF